MARGTYKKSEESRADVLGAAIKTLAARGMAETSIADIAKAAGLSKGAVHYHFESKDDLYEKVLERCIDVLEARVRAVFAQPGAPMERVRAAITELWTVRRDGVPEMRVIQEMYAVSRTNKALRKALAAGLRRSREQIVAVGVNELVAMGFKPRVPADVAPRLLVALLDGLAIHNGIEPLPREVDASVLQAIELMTAALFEL